MKRPTPAFVLAVGLMAACAPHGERAPTPALEDPARPCEGVYDPRYSCRAVPSTHINGGEGVALTEDRRS